MFFMIYMSTGFILYFFCSLKCLKIPAEKENTSEEKYSSKGHGGKIISGGA